MMIKNKTIAEYSRIKVDLLSGFLTLMLVMDGFAITLTVGILDTEIQQVQRIGIMLLVFSSAIGVALFFLAKRYIESITYRFMSIEDSQMEAIARVAKGFYVPFLICLVSNTFLAGMGALVVLALLFLR